MPELDQQKLANTVLYLLRGCGTQKPSSTALLKMLWFADSSHYRKHLRPITGGQYVALERGPVLDGYQKVFGDLETGGVVTKSEVPVYGGKPKVEYAPQEEPNDDLFSESEREILDEVISHCVGKSGNELSELTHRDGAPWIFAWSASQPGRPIPYGLVRWMDNLPGEADLVVARGAIGRPAVAAAIKSLNKTTAKAR
jgi:uncharacterized phage-associated protein